MFLLSLSYSCLVRLYEAGIHPSVSGIGRGHSGATSVQEILKMARAESVTHWRSRVTYLSQTCADMLITVQFCVILVVLKFGFHNGAGILLAGGGWGVDCHSTTKSTQPVRCHFFILFGPCPQNPRSAVPVDELITQH